MRSARYLDGFAAQASSEVCDAAAQAGSEVCDAAAQAGSEVCDAAAQAGSEVEEEIIRIQSRPGGYENLGKLLLIDPTSLSPSAKIDYLAALEKQYSWLYSLVQAATLAIAGEEPSSSDGIFEGIDEAEREDISTALRLSPNTAQSRIDVARTLSKHLPATCSALANGEISASHATLIARETNDALVRGISPEVLTTIEAKALAHCEFHTAAQVGKKMKTLFAKFAPEVFEERAESARDTRNIRIFPEGDGMSTLIALLPAEDAQTVMMAINLALESEHDFNFGGSLAPNFDGSQNSSDTAWATHLGESKFGSGAGVAAGARAGSGAGVAAGARAGSGAGVAAGAGAGSGAGVEAVAGERSKDGRSIDMKRADALTRIATHFLSRFNETKSVTKRPVTLNITMDLPTVLGLADNPAQLAGHGPIPASVGRKLAADAKWRKFITDPTTGNLLDMGRESYVPSQYLVEFLTARDRTCRFPGCSQPSRVGDIDHALPWNEGGSTNRSNLGFLCRRHHRLKTHGKWKLLSHDDGSCTWTSPSGKTYFVPSRPMDQSL